VKPEIITSYASQKKRLLAKAQSECLIGMKQEPGLDSSTNGHDVDHNVKYSIGSSNIGSSNNNNSNKSYHNRDNYHPVPAHGNHGSSNNVGMNQQNNSTASSSNGDYHGHHHTQFPPPAHHHHHSVRNENLRVAEVAHAQLLREAHTLKPTTAWGPSSVPQHSYRQEISGSRHLSPQPPRHVIIPAGRGISPHPAPPPAPPPTLYAASTQDIYRRSNHGGGSNTVYVTSAQPTGQAPSAAYQLSPFAPGALPPPAHHGSARSVLAAAAAAAAAAPHQHAAHHAHTFPPPAHLPTVFSSHPPMAAAYAFGPLSPPKPSYQPLWFAE